MGMAYLSEEPEVKWRVPENHVCHFYGHKRASPAGANRRGVSVIVAECKCGKLRALLPDKLTYWDRRWITRVNLRVDRQNKSPS